MKNRSKNNYVFAVSFLQTIILLFSPIILIYRLLKRKEDSKRFIEKYGIATRKKNKKNLIWFHGASVGELLSIIPLLNHYDKDEYIDQILVTSSTLSSSKVLKNSNIIRLFINFILWIISL